MYFTTKPIPKVCCYTTVTSPHLLKIQSVRDKLEGVKKIALGNMRYLGGKEEDVKFFHLRRKVGGGPLFTYTYWYVGYKS